MAKTRISLSVDSSLLKRADRKSSGNRSALVEAALRKYLGEEIPAVILAGGPAKGLYSPDIGTYRPLAKLANGITLIENAISRFTAAGINRIIIVGSKEVNSAIFAQIGNGTSLGAAVEYIEESSHAGSLHSLSFALKKVDGVFAFAACDHYFDFDVAAIRDFHLSQDAGVTLALYAGTAFEWSRTSVVEVSGTKVVKYEERPLKPSSHVIATMLGFANSTAFAGFEPQGSLDAAFASLAKKGLLNGFVASGHFANVHSKKDIESVNRMEGKR